MNVRKKNCCILVIIAILFSFNVFAQNIERPPLWGIARITFRVSNFNLARDYYGKFLGFDEAFSYQSENGEVISFKVNDRQFLEFVEDKEAKTKERLISVSFETENVEQMRIFLESKGMDIPSGITIDGAGNKVLLVSDPSGIPVEFIEFRPNSLHVQSNGKYLSNKRISKRIHHLGLYTKNVDANNRFYKDILSFKEMWRFDEDNDAKTNFIYLHMPECIENIEYFVSNNPNVCHPCFLVDDMQETIYVLKERKKYGSLANPIIGKGNRWLLNLINEDGIKTEFTEAHTVR